MGTDWYPNSRDEQLHMVKTWNTVFATSGQVWGIPQDHITQLVNDEGTGKKDRPSLKPLAQRNRARR
ncbi:MAG: hypothetical protein LBD93_10545 [Treponema sp.]|jgi:hypothetical protein|nr:hypothetical protein [Treponema sp.]